MKARIAIIGAGVSGLTSGVELLGNKGFEVHLLASETWETTVSSKPAAIWYPYASGPGDKVKQWAQVTYDHLVQLLESDPACCGISMVDFDVFSENEKGRALVEWLKPADLCGGGFRIRVPVIEVPIYLRYLKKRFERTGQLIPRTLVSLDELKNEYDVVVNCSGYGAGKLCKDKSVYRNRGQVARVLNPGIERAVADLDTKEMMYIIPRPKSGDCILGGTGGEAENVDDGDVDDSPVLRKREAFVSRCIKAEPQLKGLDILDETVGFRPCRKAADGSGNEIRLQIDQNRRVVHNYGHGGSGFTLSWGCAKEVRRLVESILSERRGVAEEP